MAMNDTSESSCILIGNTFPINLVRRDVAIRVVSPDELRIAARGRTVLSFWGHADTLAVASAFIGFDLTPRADRPVLTLTGNRLPSLDGIVFSECWILSPDYKNAIRPSLTSPVPPDEIVNWVCLNISWSPS